MTLPKQESTARAVRVAVIVRGRAHCHECAPRVHTVLRGGGSAQTADAMEIGS